jgi:hypothetical protein
LCGRDYPCIAAKRRKQELKGACELSHVDDVEEKGAGEDYVDIELPEYDIRQTAAARDPLAVVEAHRLNVCLRLAYLLGLRMCPMCPRCNNEPWGCQDLFGSNMRPSGGTLGGAVALEIGNEHQMHGTPHAHGQLHVVCLYQFATLQDIATKVEEELQQGKARTLLDQMRSYQDWYHVERVLDPKEHDAYEAQAKEEFFEGFQDSSNAPLSQTPAYLDEDARDKRKDISFEKVLTTQALVPQWEADGQSFTAAYLRDAQFVFNRVQHHVHHKQADGTYLPLNSCKRKSKKDKKHLVKKNAVFCKADFPRSNVLTDKTVVVCQGMARRFKLQVRGRRNAFGLWQGERTDIWQSATTPSLAVHFRSNSHTMPNYRVPLTPAIHTAVCSCSACQTKGKEMLAKLSLKTVAKISQRVQRECTGYYCGYTFKGQAIGRKYLLKASKSLDYLTETLEKKTPAQRMHHITNKCFSDMFHRCCSRPTAEEWNLATFCPLYCSTLLLHSTALP